MIFPIADVIHTPTNHPPFAEPVLRVESGLLGGSMSLANWRGDMTLFDGFYNTLPVDEFQDVDWETCITQLAADQPDLPLEKSRARYFVPSLLREAPLVGETKAKMERLGLTLIGRQRSGEHVIAATSLVTEFDGIDEAELGRIEKVFRSEGLTYLIYSTYSHGKLGKTGIRVRIVIPVDRALNAKDYALAACGLNRLVLGGNADPSGFKLCQQQGVWATAPDRLSLAFKREYRAGVASASALIAAAPSAAPKKSVLVLLNFPVIFDGDRVRAALNWISPENYDDWISVGLWLKAAYGDEGFLLWTEWSDKASESAKVKNNDGVYAPDKKWSDIDPRMPSEAGAGMLFLNAKLRALDAVRQGMATGQWGGVARDGLVYLGLYHPSAYREMVGDSL